MIRPSTMLFLFSAVFFFIGSLIYLTLPVSPGIESVTDLTALELSYYGQHFNSLTATLESIIGANLLALALLTVYVGFKAWQDNLAWAIGLLSLLCYALPLIIVAAHSNGMIILALLPVVPYTFGLVLALTLDREWKTAGPKWPYKTVGGLKQ
jgi:peptidoglycan/LPS O-acetylase OafA/YrhL